MNEPVKIVVTVPEADANALRKAIGDAGGGKFGNYSHCSFSVKGTGRFTPTQGANPTIGHVGQAEEVTEERIEITCTREQVPVLVKVIREAHPYEEPAIDAYLLISTDD